MDNTEKVCISIIIALGLKKRRKRKKWVKDWIGKRNSFTYLNLSNEIKKIDMDDFQNYFRMDYRTYSNLLEILRPLITKKNTVMKESISANERLAITLTYLVTGKSFGQLRYSGVMGRFTISGIVLETCEAIIAALKDYINVTAN